MTRRVRVATWNVNGLGSFHFPLPLFSYRTHSYPSSSPSSSPSSAKEEDILLHPLCLSSPPFPSVKRRIAPLLVHSYRELFDAFDADILCLQEVKVAVTNRHLLGTIVQTRGGERGFDFYFSFSRKRRAYSGVLTIVKSSRASPVWVEEGLTGLLASSAQSTDSADSTTQRTLLLDLLLRRFSIEELRDVDAEGRCLISDHGAFVLFNLYVPNAGDEREDFKQLFSSVLRVRIDLFQQSGRCVLVVGDLNIAYELQDSCQPEPWTDKEGILHPFETSPSRRWLQNLVWPAGAKGERDDKKSSNRCSQEDGLLFDVFRHFHPFQRKAYTCWNTLTNARTGNFGSRIDHILASRALQDAFVDCRIYSFIEGSDHCPVSCDFDEEKLWPTWQCGLKPHALASCYWKDFAGFKTLKQFFTLASKQVTTISENEANEEARELPVQTPLPCVAMLPLQQSSSSPSRKRSATIAPGHAASLTTKQKPSALATKKKKQKKNESKGSSLSPLKNNSSLFNFFQPSSSPVLYSPLPDSSALKRTLNSSGNAVSLSNETNASENTIPIAAAVETADDKKQETECIMVAEEEFSSPFQYSPSSKNQCSSTATIPSSDEKNWLCEIRKQFALENVLCDGHQEAARRYLVNKKGPNNGRYFWCCNRSSLDRCKVSRLASNDFCTNFNPFYL